MGADNKSNFKKCGEILINLNKKNKKTKEYIFHCTFCEMTWNQMKKFAMHLEELHLQDFEEIDKDLPKIYEPEIKVKTTIGNKTSQYDKIPLVDILKEDPLETKATLLEKMTDIKEYSEAQVKYADYVDIELNVKNQQMFDNDSDTDDNDEDYKPYKAEESSSCEEIIEDSDDESKSKAKSKKIRKFYKMKLKRQKANKSLPELAEDSVEKDLNIALLQAFEKKPFLWDVNEKCRNESICQKGYEEIANEIRDNFPIDITWELAKNRINNMRFEWSYEMEKQHNGENYKIPWYIDHIKYLQQNIDVLTRDRIKKNRFKNIKEIHLPAIIDLYKKYEDLWQVNSVFFGISSKRDEIFNKMIEELKLNFNVDLTFERLRIHIKYINRLFSKDKDLQLKCELSKSDFSPTSNFYNELSFLSDCQGPFKCLHCNEIIKNYEKYHIHVSEHTKTRPFKCALCKATFTKFDTCISHVKRHLSENNHCCDICGKSYPRKSELDRHLTYHTGEKPFLCQVCGNGFRTSRHYDNHIRRHENRFRYECHICKMGINQLNTLNDHVKSHLNLRDIFCNVCGKGFTAARYLNNHKLIHEDKKHYKCHICGKEFAQGAGLRAHRKLHKTQTSALHIKRERKESKVESLKS